MDQQQETTVVIADDHAIVRERIAALCATQGFKVIGQCSDGQAAVQMVNTLKPDIAVLDAETPGLAGIEVIRRLRLGGCTTKLMILTVSQEDTFVQEALRAGADAYVLKDVPSRDLLDAISFVRDGGVWISPLLRRVATQRESQKPQDLLASLSPKEREVLEYLLNGLRARDIADRMETTLKAVDMHRVNLMRKLNVNDLVELVKFWRENLGDDRLARVHTELWPRLPHRPPRAAAAEPPEDSHYKIE